MKKFAILFSLSGTLADATYADGLTPAVVIADRPCRGYNVAKSRGIPAVMIDRNDYCVNGVFDRMAHTLAVIKVLDRYGVDLVAMMGWMTILHKVIFTTRYKGRILNSHPSLLPAFKGEKAVRDALAAGVTETGCTIHVATEVLDDETTTLAQKVVPILPGDTEDILWERIKVEERLLWPKIIRERLGL